MNSSRRNISLPTIIQVKLTTSTLYKVDVSMALVLLVHGADLCLDRPMHAAAELLPVKLLQAGEGAGVGDTLQRSELATADVPRWLVLVLVLVVQSHGIIVVQLIDLVVGQDGVHGLEGAAADTGGPEVGGVMGRGDGL